MSRSLAQAAPFASDWLHRAVDGGSVHLAEFPEPGARDEPVERAMDAVRRLASLARAARETASLRVRQPLRQMQVAVPASARGPAFDELLGLLASEVNVRHVAVASSDADLVRLRARPNFRALGKRFGKRTPQVAEACAALPGEQLRVLESGGSVPVHVDGEALSVGPDDVTVEREVVSSWLVQSDGPFVVALDPALDDSLRAEGPARELVNRVQRLRKEAGYEFTTRIGLWLDADEAVIAAGRAHEDFIREETLARGVHFGARASAPDLEQAVDIDGVAVWVGLKRHDTL